VVLVTDRALDALETLLASREDGDNRVARLAAGDQGVTLRLDRPRPDDQLVRDGAPLLVVEAALARRLRRAVLDYGRSPRAEAEGHGTFTLRRAEPTT
jgi:hypothetical protein